MVERPADAATPFVTAVGVRCPPVVTTLNVPSERASVVGFFFFQAEDGIRDKLVTGVQTCALPILARKAGTMSPSHGRDMGALYLLFWLRNYPHDRGTRPAVSPSHIPPNLVVGRCRRDRKSVV